MKNLLTSGINYEYYDSLPGGVFIYKADDQEQVLYVNDEVLRLFGCANRREFDNLTGGTFKGMLYPADLETVEYDIKKQIEGAGNIRQYDHISYRIQNKQGEILYVEDFGRLVNVENIGPVFVVFVVDIHDKFNSYVADTLTNLMGMRHFFDVMEMKKSTIIRSNDYENWAIVYFNLLDFKSYNATFGIEAGDRCLKDIADILREVFHGDEIARFSADYFVVMARNVDLEDKIREVHGKVRLISSTTDLNLIAGIKYFTEEDKATTVAQACDQAKIACDFIKRDGRSIFRAFDNKLGRELELRSYIVENVDTAIENGYIQVYYQPVIRSLTGKLCGAEALTRWIDPNYGMISPGVFIPLLEEAHLIHKLDGYVLHQVGKRLREEIDRGRQVVPISFNFSRMDFLVGHPFERLEEVCGKYRLQSNLMVCEITESTLMADKDRMSMEIDRLHQFGYEVWMDDFGSGYSTLNILKEYHFDEIKLDMDFLRNLNDAGKHILRSLVSMAKGLGIHTLAEGAETEEQVEFLKSIGCERIQGYYYGKPQPYEDMLQHCRDFGIVAEDDAERFVFNQSGLEDINVPGPVAIMYDDGQHFVPLLANDEFIKSLQSMGTNDLDQMQKNMDSPYHATMPKIRQFIQKPILSQKMETMTMADSGQYMRLGVKHLAGFGDMHVHKWELHNITYNEDENQSRFFDTLIRNASQIFREIYLWDVKNDERRVLQTSNDYEKAGDVIPDVYSQIEMFAENKVYVDDREEFYKLMNPELVYDIVKRNGLGFMTATFRVLQKDGNYHFLDFIGYVNFKMEGKPILLLVKDTQLGHQEYRKTLARKLLNSHDFERYTSTGEKWALDGELWRNMMRFTPRYYFWKDKDRRFMGTSKSFLDTFGIKDLNEIVGKTDEDMGWNLNDYAYRRDEEEVLTHGTFITDSIGSCVIDGVHTPISATKLPIYEGGDIIGLLGYFEVIEEAEKQSEEWAKITYTDEITGCLNYRGAMDAGLRLEDGFRLRDQNYVGVLIDVPEYESMYRRYGEDTANKILVQTSELIRKYMSRDAVISRVNQSRFVVFDRSIVVEAAREDLMKLAMDIHQIHEVDGYPCTLYMHYTFAWRNEVKSLDGMVALLMERMASVRSEDFASNLYSDERIILDREKLNDMDEYIYIADPNNYDLLYMNKKGRLDLGLSEDFDLNGKKCYEVIFGYKEPCSFCSNPMCSRDKFYTWHHRNEATGQDYMMRDTLIPWKGKHVKLSMNINLTEYDEKLRHGQEVVFKELAVNDAIAIAMAEAVPDKGINKMLAKLGEAFEADRAYIFEDEGKRVTSNTYEWCREGINPVIRQQQHVSAAAMSGFYREFDKKKPVIIFDVEDYKKSDPRMYENLRAQDVKCMIAVQLKIKDRELGFLGLDNPTMGNADAIGLMLSTLSKFVAFLLRDRDAIRKLDILGTRDALTNVMNRNALRIAIDEMDDQKSYAFVFGDLNGLKTINDTLGHKAGDEMIKASADVLIDLVGSENVYRMGGDEFLLVQECATQSDADELLAKIRRRFEEEKLSIALGCVLKTGKATNISDLLKEADRRMYLNKQMMHKMRDKNRL